MEPGETLRLGYGKRSIAIISYKVSTALLNRTIAGKRFKLFGKW